MLQIDGSYGEGGGQIVRTAVALSVLTKQPIEITNIRANRPKPGLQAQHYTAVSCMKSLCHAKTEDLSIGSSQIRFTPGNLTSGEYAFDIGTAGSMILIFEACILGSLHATSPVKIKLVGGSDVKWAPSWDYFTYVFLPLLKKMGITVEAQLLRRGYYPKGGGEAIIMIHPCTTIVPLQLQIPQKYNRIDGHIHLAGLPNHITTRMKHAAIKTLLQKNLPISITTEETSAPSEGTGITLWSSSENTILGSSVLGEKGVSAETIGESAATQLLQDINACVSLDIHAFDQLLPYMMVASQHGKSQVSVRMISSHAKTNMWLCEQFFKKKILLVKNQNMIQITV